MSLDPPFSGNPRTAFRGRHRERGPKRYVYTAREVAQLARMPLGTLRWHQTKGHVKISDLASVVDFVIVRRSSP